MKHLLALLLLPSMALAADVEVVPKIPLFEVAAGKVVIDCTSTETIYKARAGSIRSKAALKTNTWKDEAEYQDARADYLACISTFQKKALEAERLTSNGIITEFNQALQLTYEVNATIQKLDQEYELCEKLPVSSEHAKQECGKEQQVYECGLAVTNRALQREEAREGGPWGHIQRAVAAQILAKKVILIECMLNNVMEPPQVKSAPKIKRI